MSDSFEDELDADPIGIFDDEVSNRINRIIWLLNKDKSLTKGNKETIVIEANRILKATTFFCKQMQKEKSQNISQNKGDIDNDLKIMIKDTINAALSQHNKQVSTTQPVKPSYSTITRTPTTKPALIINSMETVNNPEETFKNLKQSITFQDTNFAPTNIKYLSNNKIKIEFDKVEHRDITMKKIENPESKVRYEIPKNLKPSIILKGISTDIPSEELTTIISKQNDCIKQLIQSPQDLEFKFKKSNKNEKLYNAVFVTTPEIFKAVTQSRRINIDYYRIHASEYVPILQCYKCLKFGHTKNHCNHSKEICSFCATEGHDFRHCPFKQNPQRLKCHNCHEYNQKHKITDKTTSHSATSNTCPRVHTMMKNIQSRINYGPPK